MESNDLHKLIAALTPRSKAARLWELMPAIEAKLAQGVTADQIVEALNRGGLMLTHGTFRTYLSRYRKQCDAAGADAGLRGRRHLRGSGERTLASRHAADEASWPTRPASNPAAAIVRDDGGSFDEYARIGKALSRKTRQRNP